MSNLEATKFLAPFCFALLLSACGGGAGGGGAIPAVGNTGPLPPRLGAPPPSPTPSPSPAPASAGGSTPTISAACYQWGTSGCAAHPVSDGAAIEWGSPLILQLDRPSATFTITPYAKLYVDGGVGQNKFRLRWHRVPGVTYAITAGGNVFHVATPAVVPIPGAAGRLDLGALIHPWIYASDPAKVSVLQSVAGTITHSRTDVIGSDLWGQICCNFTSQVNTTKLFSIMDRLHAAGIDEWPDFIQYGVPRWEDATQTNIWKTPADYASFISAVLPLMIAHAQANGYALTHVVQGNEWNQGYWCQNGNGSNCRDGNGLASYWRAGYNAVKAVDPALLVVTGEFADGGGSHVPFPTVLQKVLSDGCESQFKCGDIWSVHAFDWGNDPAEPRNPTDETRWDNYKILQGIFMGMGLPKPSVVNDEFGYSHDPNDPFGLDQQVAARYMAEALNAFASDPTFVGLTNASVCDGDDGGSLFGSIGLETASGCVPDALYGVFRSY